MRPIWGCPQGLRLYPLNLIRIMPAKGMTERTISFIRTLYPFSFQPRYLLEASPENKQQEAVMELNEVIITRAIVETFMKKLMDSTEIDVAIVGGGPSGLVAAERLASGGKKVVLFEKKLSVGGGMWGGGMLFNEIVVQSEAVAVLQRYGIRVSEYTPGYYTADAVECVTTIASAACRAGAVVLNCMAVEDIVLKEGRACGLVINWTPVEMTGLHVDPLTVSAGAIIDCTGHDTEVLRVMCRKAGVELSTPSGKVAGERPMWADVAEKLTLANTGPVFPGVYVAGMSANAAFGGPRMGPIFGGMLLSGEKVAGMILSE